MAAVAPVFDWLLGAELHLGAMISNGERSPTRRSDTGATSARLIRQGFFLVFFV
ncbi:MAG: hypothetical protein JWM35_1307, partial [Verrucomicrobia bacterium]|nr:hypothetical protein [Verrucomicrobiota bacterium]